MSTSSTYQDQPRVISNSEIATLLYTTVVVYIVVLSISYLYDTYARAVGIKPATFSPGVPNSEQPIKVRILLFLGSNQSSAGAFLLLAEIILGLGACERALTLRCCCAALAR